MSNNEWTDREKKSLDYFREYLQEHYPDRIVKSTSRNGLSAFLIEGKERDRTVVLSAPLMGSILGLGTHFTKEIVSKLFDDSEALKKLEQQPCVWIRDLMGTTTDCVEQGATSADLP